MKRLLPLLLLSLSLQTLALEPELSPKQKLAAAEAVVALVTGPIALPVATLTGQKAALCELLEGPWVKPSSYDPNSDGRDQCPKGNWLRVIPFLSNLKEK